MLGGAEATVGRLAAASAEYAEPGPGAGRLREEPFGGAGDCGWAVVVFSRSVIEAELRRGCLDQSHAADLVDELGVVGAAKVIRDLRIHQIFGTRWRSPAKTCRRAVLPVCHRGGSIRL